MKYFLSLYVTVILLFTFIIPEIKSTAAPIKEVAIVIDDLGNNMRGTEEILNLPIPLTVAIMPFMPSTQRDAELAHKNGHEVIVHMPMEPLTGKSSWLGPGAITSSLTDQEIRKRVEEAFDDVPYAVGMNNHMGSKITEDKRIMKIILEVCEEKGKYYLDSKTSNKSVVKELASEMSVPILENNHFFDQIYTKQYIGSQAELLVKKLSAIDQIIAIGHVGVSGNYMYDVLLEYIPKYKKIASFVTLSDLIPEYQFIK